MAEERNHRDEPAGKTPPADPADLPGTVGVYERPEKTGLAALGTSKLMIAAAVVLLLVLAIVLGARYLL